MHDKYNFVYIGKHTYVQIADKLYRALPLSKDTCELYCSDENGCHLMCLDGRRTNHQTAVCQTCSDLRVTYQLSLHHRKEEGVC